MGFNYWLLRLFYCWTGCAPVFPRGLVGVTKGWLLWLWSPLSLWPTIGNSCWWQLAMGDVGQVTLDCRVVFGGSLLCRGPASVSGSELLVGLMGHRVPPLVECYTGGSSRAPRRRRSARCSSPCGGAAPLLVGGGHHAAAPPRQLARSFALSRGGLWTSCQLSRAPHHLLSSVLQYWFFQTLVRKKCTCLFIFLTGLTHSLKWNDIKTALILWGCTTPTIAFRLSFSHMWAFPNCFAFHPWQEKNSDTWSNKLVQLTDLTPSNPQLVTCY